LITSSYHASGKLPYGRAGLVVAHPGHELTLAGWLRTVRPSVFVMTDGSGQLGRSRLHSTTKGLLNAGARPGSIYGHFSDRQVYEAMLKHDVDLFLRVTFELADWIVLDDVEYVVGDSAEGYNPMHDICRIIIGGAVELATRLRGRPIGNYEYVVAGRRDHASRDDVPARSGSGLTMPRWSGKSRMPLRTLSSRARSTRPFAGTESKRPDTSVCIPSTIG